MEQISQCLIDLQLVFHSFVSIHSKLIVGVNLRRAETCRSHSWSSTRSELPLDCIHTDTPCTSTTSSHTHLAYRAALSSCSSSSCLNRLLLPLRSARRPRRTRSSSCSRRSTRTTSVSADFRWLPIVDYLGHICPCNHSHRVHCTLSCRCSCGMHPSREPRNIHWWHLWRRDSALANIDEHLATDADDNQVNVQSMEECTSMVHWSDSACR